MVIDAVGSRAAGVVYRDIFRVYKRQASRHKVGLPRLIKNHEWLTWCLTSGHLNLFPEFRRKFVSTNKYGKDVDGFIVATSLREVGVLTADSF